MIKILLVDDHALMCAGITRLLSDVSDMIVVGAANSGEEALILIREKNPDIVLMDIKMPGIGGLETTRKCLRNDPSIKVIALTACTEEPFPTKVLQAGAKGYLTKNIEFADLVQAIRMVHTNHCYIDPAIAQKMALTAVNAMENPKTFKDLSEREMQVLMMITSGDTVQMIAKQLCLSPKTVHGYRYRLFEKLKVKTNVGLTHMALRYGLVTREVS